MLFKSSRTLHSPVKVDLLPLDGRQKLLARARKRLAATFAQTKFAGCPMVAVAAKPGVATEQCRRTQPQSCGRRASTRMHAFL